ncbi:MAG: TIR domain-containing protein [Chloroflexi bacterium]|nr:TIR domain-containing protein [Chloroflexota bacterium]
MSAVRTKVFVSYSHKDKNFLDRLQVHLKPIVREGIIDVWVDTKISAGDKWREEIRAAINSATIAILLVSADFLASEFIASDELPGILKAAETDGMRVLIVVVGHCLFGRTKTLSQFQAVNSPDKPLTSLSRAEQEKVFNRVAVAILQPIQRVAIPKRNFVPIPLIKTQLANHDLSIYAKPPFGDFFVQGVPFKMENARLSLGDPSVNNKRVLIFHQKAFANLKAMHLLINAGDGRKSYGAKKIGHIMLVMQPGPNPDPTAIVLGVNVREWAIGNFVRIAPNEPWPEPLTDTVTDPDSCEAWRGTTSNGQVAVIDMLTINIPTERQNDRLVGIEFIRDIQPSTIPLDYFVSGLTLELYD